MSKFHSQKKKQLASTKFNATKIEKFSEYSEMKEKHLLRIFYQLELIGAFLHQLQSHIPLNEDGDWVRWMLKKNGDFDIHPFYNALRESFSVIFSWKGVWGWKPHEGFPSLFGQGEKIRTDDNLRRRGFIIADWCCMCQCNREDVDHLLIHCEETSQLWSFFF